MDPFITSALIGAGSGIVSNIFGAGSQQQAYSNNLKLLERKFEMDKEMWNAQNEYNTPVNQRARYEAAGFNPNLIVSSATNSGNATGAPQYGMTEAPVKQPLFDATQATNLMTSILQAKNLEQQNGLLKAQTQAQAAQAALNLAKEADVRADIRKKGFDYNFAQDTREWALELSKWTAANAEATNSNLQQDYINKQATYEQIKANTNYTNAQARKVTFEISKINAEIKRMAVQNKIDMGNFMMDQRLYPLVSEKLISEIENMDADNALKKLEQIYKDLRNTNQKYKNYNISQFGQEQSSGAISSGTMSFVRSLGVALGEVPQYK